MPQGTVTAGAGIVKTQGAYAGGRVADIETNAIAVVCRGISGIQGKLYFFTFAADR